MHSGEFNCLQNMAYESEKERKGVGGGLLE